MRTRFVRAVLLATLMGLGVSTQAAGQESARDFNRQDWLRQNNIFNTLLGSGAPQAKRQPPPQQRRQAPPPVQPVAAPSRQEPVRDFFSSLFGEPSRARQDDGPRARILITPSPGTRSGGGDGGRSSDGRSKGSYSSGGTGVAAYCVRTCDGRYFPVQGHPSSARDPNAVAQCAAFCPAASTEVYLVTDSAKGIEGSENKDGRSYTALPNAFAFRERVVANCSCRADGQPLGIGHVDVMHDPTLKRGDIVMTSDGAKVFTGEKSRPPFRDLDFVAPQRFPELPRSLRQRIAELTVL